MNSRKPVVTMFIATIKNILKKTLDGKNEEISTVRKIEGDSNTKSNAETSFSANGVTY